MQRTQENIVAVNESVREDPKLSTTSNFQHLRHYYCLFLRNIGRYWSEHVWFYHYDIIWDTVCDEVNESISEHSKLSTTRGS